MNQEPWFGSYGFSSKVIQSNLSNFIVFLWSFVKLGLLKLIIRALLTCLPSLFKIKINFLNQILT